MQTIKSIEERKDYLPADDWLKIKTIDMHTAGEPLRVIIDGFPQLQGNTMLEYRNFVMSNYNYLRTALMFEPRGHADMYGCILTKPVSSDADFGILFMHNEGYSTMCGHAIIAIAKLAVEMGWVEMVEPITKIGIDAPCGYLSCRVSVSNGKVVKTSFDNVPSFVVALDQEVVVPGLGKLSYDLAYGGAFYAFVDADKIGVSMSPDNYQGLIEKGMDIKHAVISSADNICHPFEPDLSFLYGTIFTGKAQNENIDSRNICIFAEGEVDRSPTGSGVSARMAIEYARNKLGKNEWMTIESILGSTFKCCYKQTVNYGPFKAVIPTVEGTAYITGQHQFLIDPDDPMKEGFILR